MGPVMADVGDVSGALRQNGFIGRLHVCVRAEHSGDAAVCIIAECALFAGGFRVKSTMQIFGRSGVFKRVSSVRNGQARCSSRYTLPIKLMTAICVRPRSKTVMPLPGASGGKFAGRMTQSLSSI